MQEITALNAAGGLMVANITKNFDEGIEMAMQAIKTGKTRSHFVEFVKNCGNPTKIKEAESF